MDTFYKFVLLDLLATAMLSLQKKCYYCQPLNLPRRMERDMRKIGFVLAALICCLNISACQNDEKSTAQ
ncbi:hypothetical protein, partial [Desulfovibrio sp.]|uniref:hypothetical protein n=1 Tax=Desulfovibrio sp. TaxID=885 RepID=UPI0026070A57